VNSIIPIIFLSFHLEAFPFQVKAFPVKYTGWPPYGVFKQ